MKLGTLLPSHATGSLLVSPNAVRTWAEQTESKGFAGLWALSHPVKPPIYNTAFLDPLITLSHAAAVTDDIPLGTSILLLPLRRTADVASCALTLQHLAGRRLTLGLGAGNNPKEFEVADVSMHERGPRLTEGIEVLRELFAGETSFSGQFHDFEDIRIDPQLDISPRLISGGSSNLKNGKRHIPTPVLDRITNADGWIAPPSPLKKVEHDWNAISEYAKKDDRNPNDIDQIELQYIHIVDDDPVAVEAEQREVFDTYYGARGYDHAAESCLVGTIGEIQDKLDGYEKLGFDEVILGPATYDSDDLDRQMELISEHLLPKFI